MDSSVLINTLILALIPISELRGALPYCYFNGNSLLLSFILAVGANLLVIPLCWIFLETLNRLLLKMKWYERLFDRTLRRAREKVGEKFNRFGYAGLMLFVGIPLPITGAWTGVLGAWVLGLDKKKAAIFIALGILMSACIVTALLSLGVGLNSIFIKKVQ